VEYFVKDITISASVERNEEEANRVTKIHLNFTVEGENLKLDQLEKSLEVSKKNCAMVQSVKDAINITETVEIRQA
jgi:putative redox protein